MAFERLDMNRSVPPSTDDLSQSFRVILIGFVDLHLEGSACVPGVETNDFQAKIAEFARSLCERPLPHADSLRNVQSNKAGHR